MPGTPHGLDPTKLDELIASALISMKRIFHEQLQATEGRDDGVRPQFALLCTVDPRTGGKIGPTGVGLTIIVPSHFDNEEDKDHVAMVLRALSITGEVAATIACFDTYMATDDAAKDYEKRGILPRDNPKSVEAMMVAIERRGRPVECECVPYKRLADDIQFDDSSRKTFPSNAWGGRFAHLVVPAPPPPIVATMRQMVAAGVFGELRWEQL